MVGLGCLARWVNGRGRSGLHATAGHQAQAAQAGEHQGAGFGDGVNLEVVGVERHRTAVAAGTERPVGEEGELRPA